MKAPIVPPAPGQVITHYEIYQPEVLATTFCSFCWAQIPPMTILLPSLPALHIHMSFRTVSRLCSPAFALHMLLVKAFHAHAFGQCISHGCRLGAACVMG